jgi:hypothetical protein
MNFSTGLDPAQDLLHLKRPHGGCLDSLLTHSHVDEASGNEVAGRPPGRGE